MESVGGYRVLDPPGGLARSVCVVGCVLLQLEVWLEGAAQVLVVAAEGLPAITVEDQVGDDLHGAFLVLGGVRGGSVAFFQLGAQA